VPTILIALVTLALLLAPRKIPEPVLIIAAGAIGLVLRAPCRPLSDWGGGTVQWVTRRQIRVNRAATAWLIRRFIDPGATFTFVEPGEVAAVERRTGAIGFDAPGARYPHKDDRNRCSFEALVQEHRPDDPALRELGRIVHSADFKEGLTAIPEAAGLLAISQGFPMVARDDLDTLERASFLYDALYAFLQQPRP